MSRNRLAVDVGGTFIDFVLFDETEQKITIEKVSSGGKLEEKFFDGQKLLNVDLCEIDSIVHGSTMVVNTIIQEKGANVGLITTEGFRDVLELGRGNRVDVYDLFYKQPEPLVPRYLRYEVPERLDNTGAVLKVLDENAARQAVRALGAEGISVIAVCFLHGYINDVHERRMAEIISEEIPNAHISTSSSIVREWLEYERTSTTVLNAYTQPPMAEYLSALEVGLLERSYSGSFMVMQSSGGTTSSSIARSIPIRTLQSGPAGGAIGAFALGQKLGLSNLVSADVGGTTFDVSMVVDGTILEKSRIDINRRPVLQPSIDIVSVGAGGGSIAWLDKEGGLQIGPQSAQAVPGPACFGQGGKDPTVTDAQVILGYLDPEYYLGNRMTLDKNAARMSIKESISDPLNMSVTEAARGIVDLTNMNMVLAIRQVTIERGQDPRDYSLVCFGGGGGLFAGALMRELEMPRAIIPVNPATFSAWGLLNAEFREDMVRTQVQELNRLTPKDLEEQFIEMDSDVQQVLVENKIDPKDIRFEHWVECRYIGQSHTVRVPVWKEDFRTIDLAGLKHRFDESHERAYAHALPTYDAELVNLRVTGWGSTTAPAISAILARKNGAIDGVKGYREVEFSRDGTKPVPCAVYDRFKLGAGSMVAGPAIIEESTSTTLIDPSHHTLVDEYGNLIIEPKRL